MEKILIDVLSTQGVFAGLLFYVLRMNKEREDKFFETNRKLEETLQLIELLLKKDGR
ncbi:BhlA/UviB family holin-like peptide [Jeotgalibacillus salarius]|uniref:Bacteriocin n=1 Tax=Jeotgalibacillus salarius TaxID=546023 RepID=A0A4Y8L816_9BACL|nr:BhlA/UviB family holin-like peptide [Jeotgalibacillus salarius]TFD96646.1 bacteriocin [Jeotgalibacillus salarius]